MSTQQAPTPTTPPPQVGRTTLLARVRGIHARLTGCDTRLVPKRREAACYTAPGVVEAAHHVSGPARLETGAVGNGDHATSKLRERLSELESERDVLRLARARAEEAVERLSERLAERSHQWQRSSVSAVIVERAAHQIWTHFVRWQEALARHRPDHEIDAAWSAFDRTMAKLPTALADEATRPDPHPVETMTQLAHALRGLLAALDDADVRTLDARHIEAANQAIQQYDKLQWVGSAPH